MNEQTAKAVYFDYCYEVGAKIEPRNTGEIDIVIPEHANFENAVKLYIAIGREDKAMELIENETDLIVSALPDEMMEFLDQDGYNEQVMEFIKDDIEHELKNSRFNEWMKQAENLDIDDCHDVLDEFMVSRMVNAKWSKLMARNKKAPSQAAARRGNKRGTT